MTKLVSSKDLHHWLQDEKELALLDVREEGVFSAEGHLLFAVCAPLSKLELQIFSLVPRKTVRLVLCDGGEGLCESAAKKLDNWGYTDVFILEGGIGEWRASGNVLFRGVNVPSKAFGEFVEHRSKTPSISAAQLKSMIDAKEKFVVLDSRPWLEYKRMNIPTGIDCPGAELIYRVHDLVDDPKTTIVVNCAGRTRSIIGAQSLINAEIVNKVVALRNGTMGWVLAGLKLETDSDRNFSAITNKGLNKARVCADRLASRFCIQTIDLKTLEEWQQEKETRSLYILDVRNPEEYVSGHLAGSVCAPGGQLVQATDKWVGTMRARLVLLDDTGVRAKLTASWLIQMGWPEVFVLEGALEKIELISGMPKNMVVPYKEGAIEKISPETLQEEQKIGSTTVVDLANSLEYKAAHIPKSWWIVRSRMPQSLEKIPGNGPLVFTSPDGQLAALSAIDAKGLTKRPIKILKGGTMAWKLAGFPLIGGFENLACQNNDVQYKAYDYEKNIEQHMQEYLSWETGLIEQVERDGTANFKHFSIK